MIHPVAPATGPSSVNEYASCEVGYRYAARVPRGTTTPLDLCSAFSVRTTEPSDHADDH